MTQEWQRNLSVMGNRQLNLSKASVKYLDRLPGKQFCQLYDAVTSLMAAPRPNDSIEMKGAPGYFRQDVGEHRIIYRFDVTTLYVLIIDKRNDSEVYKVFKRKKE